MSKRRNEKCNKKKKKTTEGKKKKKHASDRQTEVTQCPQALDMAPHIDRIDELQQVLGTRQQHSDGACQVLGQTQTELPAPETLDLKDPMCRPAESRNLI